MNNISTKRSYQNLEIPPRKLEETLLYKFLPSSNIDDESDPYASEHFRMFEFKIRKCTRSRSHDWTDCPFAHPGEKARRRCPRRFNYSGTPCVEFRRGGSCPRGDTCEFAHGVFECWLHPERYRTEACKDGKNCQRKICFFAHTSSQLRSVSPVCTTVGAGHCAYCRCHPGIHHTNSPTSILDMNKLSPPSSPPFSPAPGSGFSPASRFSQEYKNQLINPMAIKELMHTMQAMNVNANDEQITPNGKSIWMDSFVGYDNDQRSFLAYSSPSGSGQGSSRVLPMNNEIPNGPDFGWVNDLLT